MAALLLAGCATDQSACCARRAPADAPSGKSVLGLDAVWQNDAGENFQLAELHGRRVVISMFYASCEGVCVVTRDDMKAVEASLPPDVRERTAFVLVTLTPGRDSAAVLKKYRAEHALPGKNWTLLRGSPAATAELAARLGLGYGRDDSGLFRHASLITVLDETGRIALREDGVGADLLAVARAVESSGAIDF